MMPFSLFFSLVLICGFPQLTLCNKSSRRFREATLNSLQQERRRRLTGGGGISRSGNNNHFSRSSNDHHRPPALSMCERIHPEDLPEECTCFDKRPLGLLIKCLKVFNSSVFNDTIGMMVDVDPCNPEGSSVSVNVTEQQHDVNFAIAKVRAGEEQDYPIPGVSIIVPGFGNVGLDVAIYIAGNPDSLLLKIGLNACVVLPPAYSICASAIPGLNTILPWWILSGTYHFGEICGNSTSTRSTTTSKMMTVMTTMKTGPVEQ